MKEHPEEEQNQVRQEDQLSNVRVNRERGVTRTQDNLLHDPANTDASSMEDVDEDLSDKQ
jgi:hypothetical protein